ncbi:MAG: ABC transporter substrate-binding protein [Pseudomonadota bacterium]
MPHLRLSTTALTFLAFSSPAFAQDLCGGMGTGGQWIGGDEGASDISTAADVQEQMALVLGGNEYVALFNLSAPTDVRIEAEGRGAGDPQIDVFDATGGIIVSDDDSGGGGAARAETPLDPGTYCVAVRSYDGSPMTSFVRVARTDQEALTAGVATEETTTVAVPTNEGDSASGGGSCASARPLDGTLADGGLTGTASVNDGGFWSFSLAEPTAVTLKAENADADPVMTVYDSADVYLSENDDHDGLNSQIDFDTPLPAGDYCIEITAVNDNTLPITTSVSVFDPTAALRDQVNAGEVSPPLDGSYPITDLGTLDRRLLVDLNTTPEVQWYQLSMNGGGLLLIESVAVTGSVDTWLVAFDDLGRKIGLNDDYGDGLDSLIAARVQPGTYIIGVKQLEETGTGPVRMVMEHYVAAP